MAGGSPCSNVVGQSSVCVCGRGAGRHDSLIKDGNRRSGNSMRAHSTNVVV